MRKVVIITGSYPPEICGVGDYTSRLMQCADAKEWILYHSCNWGAISLVRHIRTINKIGADVINMQYPTQGYGWSMIPHLLCVYYSLFTHTRFSITLHEQSQLSYKARCALTIFLLTANRIIFTNEFERSNVIKSIPFIKKRSAVIKIFSNISSAKHIKPISDRSVDIINFGHIRPRKGLELFIDVASKLTDHYKVIIAGQVPHGYDLYYEQIKTLAQRANIELRLNLSDCEVSELLNDSKIAYLPFPDGASERRGSLLASFANGTVVATSVGRFTTQLLEDSIINTSKFELPIVLNNMELLVAKQKLALHFMQKEIPQSWNDISKLYMNFLFNDSSHK